MKNLLHHLELKSPILHGAIRVGNANDCKRESRAKGKSKSKKGKILPKRKGKDFVTKGEKSQSPHFHQRKSRTNQTQHNWFTKEKWATKIKTKNQNSKIEKSFVGFE